MPLYNISPLPIPVGFTQASPNAINDHRQITGSCFYAAPCFWPSLTEVVLIGPVGVSGEGLSLNNHGQVVGCIFVPDPGGISLTVPFCWDAATGHFTYLKGLAGSGEPVVGRPNSINDAGKICGTIGDPESAGYTSVVWHSRHAVPDIFQPGTAGGLGYAGPTSINNHDHIAGSYPVAGNLVKAFLYDPATADFNYFSLAESFGNALNDWHKPRVTGSYIYQLSINPPEALGHAFIFDSATDAFYDLDSGNSMSLTFDINDTGDVAGYYYHGQQEASLWHGLVRIDLNDPLISDAAARGFYLNEATGINNHGDIVGMCYLNPAGIDELPFVLTPVRKKIHLPKYEYLLPHFVWPDGQDKTIRPGDWPEDWPFPLPDKSPFTLVGEAGRLLEELILHKKKDSPAMEIDDKRIQLIALLEKASGKS